MPSKNIRYLSTAGLCWLSILFLYLPSYAYAAAALVGVVLENEVGGTPAKGVAISAVGANPTVTGDDGQFVLNFPLLQPGEGVSINVLRTGWSVVNDIQLKRMLPAHASQSPFEILICKASEREQWALKFYRLQGYKIAEATYRKKLVELENHNAASMEERGKLLRELAQARAQADELANRLANIPPDGMADSYNKAVSLYLNGKMDDALEVINDDLLSHQETEIANLKVGLDKKQEEIVQSWLLRGQLLRLKFDIEAAARSYDSVVRFAPTSYKAWLEYSDFNLEQKNLKLSGAGFEKALNLARSKNDKSYIAIIYAHLGGQYDAEARSDLAKKTFEEALELLRELPNNDSDYIQSLIAYVLTSLGTIDSCECGKGGEGERYLDEAINIYYRLIDKGSFQRSLGIANAISLKGVNFRNKGRLVEARRHYEASIKLYRLMVKAYPNEYTAPLAGAINLMGELNSEEGHKSDARLNFEESLKLILDLADKNPSIYMPVLASTFEHLGNLDRDENHMVESRQAFEKALAIYRRLSRIDPRHYGESLHRVQREVYALP